MSNLYVGVSKLMPLVMGNALTTFKSNAQEVIMIGAIIIIGAILLPMLGKGKKIKALGYIAFAAFVLAVLGDVSVVSVWVKKTFTFFTGVQW